MFTPRLALASLSGRSDAAWARQGSQHAGCAVLGGIAIDDPTREAARQLVDRDRNEFLPADPVAFVAAELESLADVPIRPGVNVRSVTSAPIRRMARLCADHGALLEINAHCRQAEMCATGAGETLLHESDRLASQVRAASDTGATVGVKVRAEVADVDLPAVCRQIERAGASFVHVDAMDDEPAVQRISEATNLFVIANNGVRDRATVAEYGRYGADAVSLGRPSDDPTVLERVHRSLDTLETGESTERAPRRDAP